ncbi:MAG TPA: hypothetical protein VF660_08610 [Actinomycetota bacterium]
MISSRRHVGGVETAKSNGNGASIPGPDPALLLSAVREDVRQTLRSAWVEPALEAAAEFPAFFMSAWSAIRPNVGRTFLTLARGLRAEAVDAVRAAGDVPDLRKRLERELSETELKRAEEAARAAHLVSAKSQIVVHALYRAVRGDRISGTGGEEPPIRRGVPDWQAWMADQPMPDGALATLDEIERSLGVLSAPAALRLLGSRPAGLSSVWNELRRITRMQVWNAGTVKLRRAVLAGIAALPHPIELQWTALKARGFNEDDRLELMNRLTEYDHEMSIHTLVAAFVWSGFGAPEVGTES